MAVGLDTDGDYLARTGIPSGGAGTLTNGAFADFFFGVWCYWPSSGNSHGATANGCVMNGVAGAREIALRKDGTGTVYTDPQFQAIWESGGPAQTTFVSQPPFDTWVYAFITADASNMTAGWRELGSTTWHTETAANTNAGSQYINGLYIGSASTTQVLFGYYAYARAVAAVKTTSEALTYSQSAVTASGDWGFWPLDDNTDTVDDSGNGRDLTFGGSITTQTSPTLDGARRYILVRP